MYNEFMPSDNQLRILRENKRICEEYRRYWTSTITTDVMVRNIAYALQLPETTIVSRLNQMRKGGVNFPVLQRKRRGSIVMPVADFNAIFAMEEMDNSDRPATAEDLVEIEASLG